MEVALFAEHLQDFLNQTADWKSRKVIDQTIWNSIIKYSVRSTDKFGPIKLDLFAERLNVQVKYYVNWKPGPIAVATDAFMIIWTYRQAYAFPQFCLNLTIVTPWRKSRAFYPVLLKTTMRDPIPLPPQDNLLLSTEGKTHPPIMNKINDVENLSVCKAYYFKISNLAVFYSYVGIWKLITLYVVQFYYLISI